MVYVMDGILTLLQNENILDVDGSGSVSSITTYYNQIKDMSNKNVTGSNTLNETKDVALLMQNNLTNYSNNEVVTYDELRRTKVYLIVTIVIMLFIIGIIIGLILMKSYKFVYIVSGIVLLAIAINATIAILRSQNII
jgi:ABC-type sugar transport system permease subunit